MRFRTAKRRATISRRRLLQGGAACLAGLLARPGIAAPSRLRERELAFYNLHTGESLKTVFWSEGRYLPESLASLDHLLRDHRSGEVRPIDIALLDLLHELRRTVGSSQPFHVISGYRSPQTNAYLRTSTGGVAKTSLHTVGQAIDIRLPGIATAELQRAAAALRGGGVGYYPKSDFVHVDTGRVRYW